MAWIQIAQLALTFLSIVVLGVIAIYVRAIQAEFWRQIFEESDKRYVSVKDCALMHSSEILQLRLDISEWRREDRHAMRNEMTPRFLEVSERADEALNDRIAELRREIDHMRKNQD